MIKSFFVNSAWAVGGDMEMIIPPEYGYPVGGNKNDFKYFFIQMHYENPEKLKDIQVKTEFQFYGTTEYRPIEFGVMQVKYWWHDLFSGNDGSPKIEFSTLIIIFFLGKGVKISLKNYKEGIAKVKNFI